MLDLITGEADALAREVDALWRENRELQEKIRKCHLVPISHALTAFCGGILGGILFAWIF